MHIICQIQESEITEILFLMEATKGRDLHKSLELLIKECEKYKIRGTFLRGVPGNFDIPALLPLGMALESNLYL